MTDISLPVDLETAADDKRKATVESITRLTKYSTYKLLMLVITVVVGIYLTILIANMGGYVDKIRRGQIRESVSLAASGNPKMREMPYEERAKLIEEQVRIQEDRLGLNRPFILRSFGFLQEALTLNLGRAENLTSDSGSRQVKSIILERLPSTLVLFVTANLINFFLSVFFALMLSRKYGHFMDKVVVALSPMSAAPGWFYGIFLILIFAATLKVLPFGGMVSAPPPDTSLGYGLSLVRHMILPISALTISSIFGAIYSWRTFFLIYSSEDYVEMAKAKGLNDRDIERKYILRPTLPNIITNFALSLIFAWQGAIILESVFNWPGLGRLFFFAIGQYDTPVIVGITVIFAYLLALTVFLLDFIYALVDPRVKIGSEGSKA